MKKALFFHDLFLSFNPYLKRFYFVKNGIKFYYGLEKVALFLEQYYGKTLASHLINSMLMLSANMKNLDAVTLLLSKYLILKSVTNKAYQELTYAQYDANLEISRFELVDRTELLMISFISKAGSEKLKLAEFVKQFLYLFEYLVQSECFFINEING